MLILEILAVEQVADVGLVVVKNFSKPGLGMALAANLLQ
jgi:hypothetical protein